MKKYIVWISFIIIVILAAVIYWKFAFTYSDGYRAGLLQKFSRKGTIFKTYEGEMILSSVQSNTNVAIASEKFFFSVTDDSIAKKLEQMQGQFIVVHYEQKNSSLMWRGDSEYLVDSVRVAENPLRILNE
jgi:hypothetical protein